MTENRPYILLQRLVVRAGEHIAYDQKFHAGLNIIRGVNSSGKSTILDFIFFALGGDVAIWKTAAAQCTDVSAQVVINGTLLTLHRKITDTLRGDLAIFFGPLEESEKFHYKNWSEYPYAARGTNESFSTFLFRTLGYPAVKSDQDSLITMHQVLRLAYVDQVSRKTSLMREEDWDTPLTRRMIADLLFGVYDDTLYGDEIALRTRKQELKDVSSQVIHNADIIETVEKGLDAEKLKKRITQVEASLLSTNDLIDKALDESSIIKDTSQTETEKLRREIIDANRTATQLAVALEDLQFENTDSEVFLSNLKTRLTALNESLATRQSLGDLPICPVCDVKLNSADGIVTCEFSGKKIATDHGRSQMLKVREELKFQISESESLQRERSEEIQQIKQKRELILAEVDRLLRTLRQKTNAVKSARENRLHDLYQRKGRHEAELEAAQNIGQYIEVLMSLRKREGELRAFVSELEAKIKTKKGRQRGRWEQASARIGEFVRVILSRDFDRQEEFSKIVSLSLLFEKNAYLLNGRNNYSASSTALLKNAIHFGLLFASAMDSEFRYPRFLLCDTAEEGGMEQDRSHNFQKVIADLSSKSEIPFQIILSTSSIDPSLDVATYCIGPKYTKQNKSLDLPERLQAAATEALPLESETSPTNELLE